MKKDQYSNGLKKSVEEGFIVIDEQTRTARVGANLTGYPLTIAGLLLLIRDVKGYTAELTMRHGYTVTLDPSCQEYF